MPGRGPAPKAERRRSEAPARGDWSPAPGVGWQHGPIPPPPLKNLRQASSVAWATWFGSWFAAHWLPDDLPGLRLTIRLYDQVERGEWARAGELRQMMDNYGITPKGQQDRRWARPKPGAEAETPPPTAETPADGPYAHLKAVK